MKVTPIAAPLRGERVVAVSPRMAIQVDAGWHRRLNLFTGRTLSDTALATEQRGRDGRLVSLAQLLSPGVVSGLELDLDVAAQSLYLAPGTGLTAWGEDVIIPRPLQVKVADLVTPVPGAGQFGVLLLVPVTVRRSGRFDARD